MPFFHILQHRLFYREQGSEWFGGRLKEIRCPVLFTASLMDGLLPHIGTDVASMALQVPDSQAYLYHGGDHPLMWFAPDQFRAAADMFLLQVTEK